MILGQALSTQADIHAPFGGVVPKVAMEAHQRAIDGTVERALKEAKLSIKEIDAVAVTSGPGLSLCLRVGGAKAMALAREANVPLVQVHHLEAHALVARLNDQAGEGNSSSSPPSPPPPAASPSSPAPSPSPDPPSPPPLPRFPFACVLASGGHNLTLLVRGVGDYSVLGTTLDDALGEAFDKVARMLGLDPTPSGGAAVEDAAAGGFGGGCPSDGSAFPPGDPTAFPFARPLRNRRHGANVSYAGLKTAVRMAAERVLPELVERAEKQEEVESGEEQGGEKTPSSSLFLLRKAQADLAASFQRVAVEHLADKAAAGLSSALEEEPACSALVLTGGVARNKQLRGELERVAAEAGLPLVAPPPGLCTDNGVMVAWAAHERLVAGVARLPRPEGMPEPAPPGWVDCRPRWPLAATTAALREEMGGSAKWVKTARLHGSLTDLTREVLREGRGREGGSGGGNGERRSSSSALEIAL